MKLHLNIYEYWSLLQILEMFEVVYKGYDVESYKELIERIKKLEEQLT